MSTADQVRPGQRVPSSEYGNIRALSFSGMKHLNVSPLRYWHMVINPNREPEEPSKEMQIGSALHCAVLEPGKFDERYAQQLVMPEGCLVTMDDLRGWLRDKGQTPKGTRKADLIAQVQAVDPTQPVWDVLKEEYEAENLGKTIFNQDDWERIWGCARALVAEPLLQEILKTGEAEVPYTAIDPNEGVAIKARLDWVTPALTLDMKTFSQKRANKSIDQTIADAIWYEGYYRQAWWYTNIRQVSGEPVKDFLMAFVESEPPHEVRLKMLRPTTGGSVNLYWERARYECREMMRIYRDCWDRFGENPWLTSQKVMPLVDEEMKALAFA